MALVRQPAPGCATWCGDSCPAPPCLTVPVAEGWASTRRRFPDGRAHSQHGWTVQLFHLCLFRIFEALKPRRAEKPRGRGAPLPLPAAPHGPRGVLPGEVPAPRGQSPAVRRARGRPPVSGGGMRLPELCLLLLYAAGTGTEPPAGSPGSGCGAWGARGGPR